MNKTKQSSPVSSKESQPSSGAPDKQPLHLLMLATLGVVYGDIGTSPIYALRECFTGDNPLPVTDTNVLGILSLIFWTLIVIISTKYMVFVLRADNHGEGGIFALLALLRPNRKKTVWQRRVLIMVGIFGAAVLYGGVMITPAISVMSAVEGVRVATPAFSHYVIPATVIILILLFAFQRRGTAMVGSVFGPVMLAWFSVIAVLGIYGIVQAPRVLAAINPWHAILFFEHDGLTGFLVLYAVFLVTTGGEALYADLGHFGRRPIRLAWFGFVLPAVLINYFGQGARLLAEHASNVQPFYHLAPDWALLPLVILATIATCIASQAAISGAFSLTRQAVQLGQVPPLLVKQTSAEARGQIYMPAVNWMLMIAAIGLVIGFGSSSNIAAAYGISVNATMVVTTILAFTVARERGGWSLWAAGSFLLVFLTVDFFFLASNAVKVPAGGWFPLLVGLALFTIMITWQRGGELLDQWTEGEVLPVDTFIDKLKKDQTVRVPGTAVFFTSEPKETPATLEHHLHFTKALHEQVLLMTVVVEEVPKVAAETRLEVERLDAGFYRVISRYGFMQGINIPSDLANCKDKGLEIDMHDMTYYVGRKSPIAGRRKGGMAVWRDRLFALMKRNTQPATAHYQIPYGRVVEIGLQVGM